MAPMRGRGGRYRGAMRGRGGKRSGFAAARTRAVEQESLPRQESPVTDQSSSEAPDESESESASDAEEEAEPLSNAYAVLLLSLSPRAKGDSASRQEPRSKKRKLQHQIVPDEDAGWNAAENANDGDEGVNGQHNREIDSDPDGPREAENLTGQTVEEVDLEDNTDDEEGDLGDSSNNWYQLHFANPDENEIAIRVERIADNQWNTNKIDVSTGRGILQIPSGHNVGSSLQKIISTRHLHMKARLADNAHESIGDFDSLEQAIAPSIFEYRDLLFCARTVQNASRLRDITCLHALNHLLLTRDRVLKNNAKLAAAVESDDTEYRDQGFTRPKILFLLETRQACVRLLDSITKLYNFEQQENKKRFLDSFSQPLDNFSNDKPAEFRELFEGNDDNEFRIGIKLTRKTLKLYSTFYNSDIILASALGLRRAIESADPKKQDCDFLSSIEIVVMDQADATLMQNWEHAEFVFEHLNLQPKDAHGCDFSRVRSWYLDGHAPYMRQTIVLAAYLTPKLNTLFNKHMRNIAGRLKYTQDYSTGLIESLSYGIKQTFLRFHSSSHVTDPDTRFKYFNSSILPSINRLPQPLQGGLGVLIFIPSYLDFVRIRNSLVDTDFSFASISEYTEQTDVRKARSHFMNGKHSLLLYTGRAHHFHRYNIRGVRRVVFYGVPENPKFYDEIIGFMAKSIERGEISRAEANVRVCFSKWERLEMERIVGTKRVGKMMGDKGDAFDFI